MWKVGLVFAVAFSATLIGARMSGAVTPLPEPLSLAAPVSAPLPEPLSLAVPVRGEHGERHGS